MSSGLEVGVLWLVLLAGAFFVVKFAFSAVNKLIGRSTPSGRENSANGKGQGLDPWGPRGWRQPWMVFAEELRNATDVETVDAALTRLEQHPDYSTVPDDEQTLHRAQALDAKQAIQALRRANAGPPYSVIGQTFDSRDILWEFNDVRTPKGSEDYNPGKLLCLSDALIWISETNRVEVPISKIVDVESGPSERLRNRPSLKISIKGRSTRVLFGFGTPQDHALALALVRGLTPK